MRLRRLAPSHPPLVLQRTRPRLPLSGQDQRPLTTQDQPISSLNPLESLTRQLSLSLPLSRRTHLRLPLCKLSITPRFRFQPIGCYSMRRLKPYAMNDSVVNLDNDGAWSPSPIKDLEDIVADRRIAAEKGAERQQREREKARRCRTRKKRTKSEDELMGIDSGDEGVAGDEGFEAVLKENERRERDGGTPDPLLQREGITLICHQL